MLISLEDKIGINKAATALLMSFVLWVVVALDIHIGFSQTQFEVSLGNVSETLFFVMGSMVIVELIDTYGGFGIITKYIHTLYKRRMMVILCFIAFFMSALIDDLTAGIIMVTLLHKLIPDKQDRIIYASMIIIASNAGGAWSPIGDVTTILLWTGKRITPLHQVAQLFLPSLVCMVIPMLLALRYFPRGSRIGDSSSSKALSSNGVVGVQHQNNSTPKPIMPKGGLPEYIVFYVGILTMIFVPIFNELTTLPPYMCIIMGMALLWIYTDIVYKRNKFNNTILGKPVTVGGVLSRVDMATILYFMGILMSVAALNVSGQLRFVADFMNSKFSEPSVIAFFIGIISSFVDNVALVAATMGMYDVVASSQQFMLNGEFWTLLAYCAVTGGSLLIIGSATGVTIMGLEKISFMYYLKRFSWLAALGYLSGAVTFYVLNMI